MVHRTGYLGTMKGSDRTPGHARTSTFETLLAGGDRRSIAQVLRVMEAVRLDPTRVAELVELAYDADGLLAMRALDALEKLAHEQPAWVAPYKDVFIGPLADSDRWEIRLQIVRALPLFPWAPPQRARAVQILRRDITHPRTFVKAWALDSLATFAQADRSLQPMVRRTLAAFERSGSKALAARARKIRDRMA